MVDGVLLVFLNGDYGADQSALGFKHKEALENYGAKC